LLATVRAMADSFDVDGMVTRFRERAKAVRNRPLPPLEGTARREYIERAQLDYQDFAMVGDATGSLEDGILVLRIDLRPPEAQAEH
jgi:hypothetical protein